MAENNRKGEISLEEASAILGLSLPLLRHRIEVGELHYQTVNSGKRLRLADVLTLKVKLDHERQDMQALAVETEDPLETSDPVRGSGQFLHDRGYLEPRLTKYKFELVGQIRTVAEARGHSAADVAAAVNRGGRAAIFTLDAIISILQGRVRSVPLSDLRAVLDALLDLEKE